MLKKEITNDDYMSIMITHECNRKCPFCVDGYRGRNEYISIENFKKHLAVAKAHGCKDISLLGGEPTLHPQIKELCKLVIADGFNCILTTNADNLELVKELSHIVSSINISYYHQKFLNEIDSSMFGCDVTISALIFKGQLDNQTDLDTYIDKYTSKGFYCKFRTLQDVNDFTHRRKDATHEFIKSLGGEHFTMYGTLDAYMYRDCIIGISDCLDLPTFYHSLKGQVDGEVSRHWKRDNI